MNIIKIGWMLITTSKGAKRNAGITLLVLAQIASKLNFTLPEDLNLDTIESFLSWLGGSVAFIGVLHNLFDSWKNRKK